MPIFVVHKHWARTLHYDLRLEMDGVLKSWALPKGPPTRLNVKRLAVQVEDHALEYADFEGEIPPGQYGAGKVEIWDRGSFHLLHRGEDRIIFRLKGERLRGVYTLLRTRWKGRADYWLLFKSGEK